MRRHFIPSDQPLKVQLSGYAHVPGRLLKASCDVLMLMFQGNREDRLKQFILTDKVRIKRRLAHPCPDSDFVQGRGVVPIVGKMFDRYEANVTGRRGELFHYIVFPDSLKNTQCSVTLFEAASVRRVASHVRPQTNKPDSTSNSAHSTTPCSTAAPANGVAEEEMTN